MAEDHFKDRYLTERVLVERDFVTRSVAIDRILGREVVITHLNGRVGRRAAVQERFRAAARNVVRLSHSNVVALYDIGTANGFPYAVQEHTHSEPLSEIMEHEGPFHPDDVSILVEQVASALDYAALRNLPHLALSPDAITVDYDGRALVADFGIGQVLAELAPKDVSSLRYRSPEQLAGEPGDSRSDVFSLGVVAYEMLTGSAPFDLESVDSLRTSIASALPRSPSSVSPGVPDAVSSAVLRALNKNPAERYQTAGHFAEDFFGPVERTAEYAVLPPDPVFGTAGAQTGPVDVTTPLPVTDADEQIEDRALTDDAGRFWTRGSAIAAWTGVVVALGVLAFIAVSLLDDRDNPDPADNLAGNPSPTATVAATAETVEVPTAVSLIGMTLDQASSETDLTVRVVETEASDTVPAGQIIRQSPNPGRPVRTGELIVVVSSGSAPQPIQLSELSVDGVTFDDLAQQLISLGLNVSQLQEGSPTIPDGQVIRIDEQTAQPGDLVHVVISMGDRVQIPLDIHSQNVDEAADRLGDLGLSVNDPIGVSQERIESSGVILDDYQIVDGDVVGIQEETAGFGAWVEPGTELTLVYYDASLTE